MICTAHQTLFCDQPKNVTGGECGRYGAEERCIQSLGWET